MASAIEFDWRACVTVDFKVMNEDWQTLKLSDGTIMKARVVLTGVWRSKSQINPMTGEPLYTWNSFKPSRLVSYQQQYNGEQTTVPITPELIAQRIDENVDYELSGKQDEWSVYSLSDGSVMRLRLNITGIARTTLHASTGEPFYSFMTGMDNYKIKVAPDLIKKPNLVALIPKDSKSAAYA